MCHDPKSNLQPFGVRDDAPTEPLSQDPSWIMKAILITQTIILEKGYATFRYGGKNN